MATFCFNLDRPDSRLHGSILLSLLFTEITARPIRGRMTLNHGSQPMKSRSLDHYSNRLLYSASLNRPSRTIPRSRSPVSKIYSSSILIPTSRRPKVEKLLPPMGLYSHYRLLRLGQISNPTPRHLYPQLEVRPIIKHCMMPILSNTDLSTFLRDVDRSRPRNITTPVPLVPILPTTPFLASTLSNPSLVLAMILGMTTNMSIHHFGSRLLGRNGTSTLVTRLLVFELLVRLSSPIMIPRMYP
jgi:hypothetical protein